MGDMFCFVFSVYCLAICLNFSVFFLFYFAYGLLSFLNYYLWLLTPSSQYPLLRFGCFCYVLLLVSVLFFS